MRLLSRLQPRPQSHILQKASPGIPGFPRGPPRIREAFLTPIARLVIGGLAEMERLTVE